MGVSGAAVQIQEREEGPCVYYRASSLGGCTKALILARLGYEEMEQGTSDAFQAVKFAMQAGTDLEDTILDAVAEAYDHVYFERGDVAVRICVDSGLVGAMEIHVGGHVDAFMRTTTGKRVVVEAKSASGVEYEKWLREYEASGDPFKSGLWKKYAWQVSTYMHAKKADYAVLAVWNRDTGDYTLVDVMTPPISLKWITEKVQWVENAAAEMEVPGPCDVKNFPCPYYYAHEEEREGFDTEEEVVIRAMVQRYTDALAEEKRVAGEKAAAYDALKKRLEVGEWTTADAVKVTVYRLSKWADDAVTALAEKMGVDPETLKETAVKVTEPKKRDTP